MDFRFILEVVELAGLVAALGFLFYYYYEAPKFRASVNEVLFFLPPILSLLSRFVKPTLGAFGAGTVVELISRITGDLEEIIRANPTGSFESVEPQISTLIEKELAYYRSQGFQNVPNFSDSAIQTSVKVAFEQIKRGLDENRASGNTKNQG